jgi:hypothetical protein
MINDPTILELHDGIAESLRRGGVVANVENRFVARFEFVHASHALGLELRITDR